MLKEFDYLCIGNNSNMVETIIGIIFIVFVVARVLLGKEDGNDSHSGHRSQPDNLDEKREKYPPSYY
jgi:hypothetical protein